MSAKVTTVFLATPGDLEAERQIFYDFLPKLGQSLGVEFVPTGYEITPATVGERPQNLINKQVDACDLFIAVFHRRWGQPAVDSVGSGSYTEEEFNRAIRRYGETGKPTILCFFKNVDIYALADPGAQLAKVLEFKRRLEGSGLVLYRTFDSEADFQRELESHLKAYLSSSLVDPSASRRKILLPIVADAGPDLHRSRDLALVEQATHAASAGRIEEAERMFAQLSQTTITTVALDVAKVFFEQIGNTEAVQSIGDRKLALLRDRRLAAQEYVAALAAHGWLEQIITAQLSTIRLDERAKAERTLRLMFGHRFNEMMVEAMAENFTLGELRALARFYSGEGATVANKMGEFMGRVLPRFIERLQSEVAKELNSHS